MIVYSTSLGDSRYWKDYLDPVSCIQHGSVFSCSSPKLGTFPYLLAPEDHEQTDFNPVDGCLHECNCTSACTMRLPVPYTAFGRSKILYGRITWFSVKPCDLCSHLRRRSPPIRLVVKLPSLPSILIDIIFRHLHFPETAPA